MLFRIRRADRGETAILVVEGGLSADYVGELVRACNSLDRAVLDLNNLRCIDIAGAAGLAQLASRGFQLRGVSPYISMRMQHSASSPPSFFAVRAF